MKTPLQWATLIAKQIDPTNAGHEALLSPLIRNYQNRMYQDFANGRLTARDAYTKLPIDPTSPAAVVAFFVNARLSMSDVNKWLLDVGVPVSMDDDNPVRASVRATETPDQRFSRITIRRSELIGAGVRAFLKCIAEEEGVSIARIKQDLKPRKVNLSDRGAPFPENTFRAGRFKQ